MEAVARLDALTDKSAAYRVAAMQLILDEDRAEVRAAFESLYDDGINNDAGWVISIVRAILEKLK